MPDPPLQILLVEDNDGDVEMTRRALARAEPPCELSVANDGAEGRDFLLKLGAYHEAVTPHVILLDLNMPRMNGRQLLEHVKADPRLSPIPVVIFTSSEAPSDVQEAYRLHASGYVVKPFDSRTFADTVRRIASYWGTLMLLPHRARG